MVSIRVLCFETAWMSAFFNTGPKKIGGHLQSSQLSPNQTLARQLNPILVPNLRPSPLWTPQPNLSDTASSDDDSESDSESGDGELDSDDDEEDSEDELQSDYDEEDAEDPAAGSTSAFPFTSSTLSMSTNNPLSNGGNPYYPRLAWSPLNIDEEVSQVVASPDSETEAAMNVDQPLHPRDLSWSLLSIEPLSGAERGADMDIEEGSSGVDADDIADTSFKQSLVGSRLARKLSCLSIDDQYSTCYFPDTSKSNGQRRFYSSDEDDGDQGEVFSTPYFPIKRSIPSSVRPLTLTSF
jgi:hypothetical protein